VTTAQPLGKDAIGKLASALRDQPSARQAGGPGASLAIPIDEARRLCAEGLVAFANGTSPPRGLSSSAPPTRATLGRW
jgi:hypothetical protein